MRDEIRHLNKEEIYLLALLREELTGRGMSAGQEPESLESGKPGVLEDGEPEPLESGKPGTLEDGKPGALEDGEPEPLESGKPEPLSEGEWRRLGELAERHCVLPLIWQTLAEEEAVVPDSVRQRAKAAAVKTVLQSYHMLFFARYLTRKLEKAGIAAAVLKGVGTASFYPTPELRKAGDVDLLLADAAQLEDACALLETCGCTVKERQMAQHHVVFASREGITVELHTLFVEPFDNGKWNRYIKRKMPDCAGHIVRADCMGADLPVLAAGYHAWQLLLHMLQDFLRAGFGIKLLCDWTALWNHDIEKAEQEIYLGLAEESGLKRFSDIVTETCCRYLGLHREKVAFMRLAGVQETAEGFEGSVGVQETAEAFLRDVLEAGDFGRASKDRMVLMRSAGIRGYVREFHHQTCLNFPKAGRCFLCWPVLWAATLLRFLRNNRKLRRVSTRAVLKKAAQRSRLLEGLGLWG